MIEVRRHHHQRAWQRAHWWAWVVVLLCASYALATQKTATVPWYRSAIVDVTTGVTKTTTALQRWMFAQWRGESQSRHQLQQELVLQETALRSIEEMQQERERLQQLMARVPELLRPILGARVVLHNLHAPFKIIVIDRGAAHGVVPGMIAIASGGLVGRVERVTNRHAAILLLTDPNHAVDVIAQRSRVRGILQGRGTVSNFHQEGGITRLGFLQGNVDLQEGDALLTSGLDGRYPPGVPVGEVHHVDRTDEGLVRGAEVLPYFDWTTIEEVGLVAAPLPIPAEITAEPPP